MAFPSGPPSASGLGIAAEIGPGSFTTLPNLIATRSAGRRHTESFRTQGEGMLRAFATGPC